MNIDPSEFVPDEKKLEYASLYVENGLRVCQHLSILGLSIETYKLSLEEEVDSDEIPEALQKFLNDLATILDHWGNLTTMMATLFKVQAPNILVEMLQSDETDRETKETIADYIIPTLLQQAEENEVDLDSEEIREIAEEFRSAIQQFRSEDIQSLLKSIENGEDVFSKLSEFLEKEKDNDE